MGDYRIYRTTWENYKNRVPKQMDLLATDKSFNNAITEFASVLRNEGEIPEEYVMDIIDGSKHQYANGVFSGVRIEREDAYPVITYSLEYTVLS